MKITVENKSIYFFPQNEYEIFHLGKLSGKVRAKSQFDSVNENIEMHYTEITINDFIEYLFK